jgi:hypothetical protein
MGHMSNSTGQYSITLGYQNTASELSAVGIGRKTVASGKGAVALGWYTEATGDYAHTAGYYTEASQKWATAFGVNTKATGYGSTAMGQTCYANESSATAMGYVTTANGRYSTTMGAHTLAKARCSLVIGRYNDTLVGSPTTWVSTDPLLVAGNGNSSTNSDALTLYKNGNMTIAGTLTQNSDVRIKKNIKELTGISTALDQIQPVYYEFIDKETHPGGRQIGLIAQEIENTFPELVSEDSKGYLSVDYSKMTAVLLQVHKEQQQLIKDQENRINALEARLQEIERILKGY